MGFPVTGLTVDVERQAVGASHCGETSHGVLAGLVTPRFSIHHYSNTLAIPTFQGKS